MNTQENTQTEKSINYDLQENKLNFIHAQAKKNKMQFSRMRSIHRLYKFTCEFTDEVILSAMTLDSAFNLCMFEDLSLYSLQDK